MTMEADEINEGLARYLWPDASQVSLDRQADAIYVEEPDVTASGVVFPGAFYHALFTDSLDACEKVAEKLGVSAMNFHIREKNAEYVVELWYGRVGFGRGPTRSHALAAALWAAVRETK